jgi:hypothetical protein
MAAEPLLARLRAALITQAGGYLRNTVRRELVTCAVCAQPSAGNLLCSACTATSARTPHAVADATGFLVYAVPGRQSGYVMRGYKASQPVGEHRTIVALLAVLGLAEHGHCPGRLLAAPVTHWAVVPSLPARSGDHPRRPIVRTSAPGTELPLSAAACALTPRSVDPRHFTISAPVPPGAHVLVIDDTWVRGGHAQSAVLAARRAGAAHVSVLVVARWLSEDYGGNARFLTALAIRDYDPGLCPWTGGACP